MNKPAKVLSVLPFDVRLRAARSVTSQRTARTVFGEFENRQCMSYATVALIALSVARNVSWLRLACRTENLFV